MNFFRLKNINLLANSLGRCPKDRGPTLSIIPGSLPVTQNTRFILISYPKTRKPGFFGFLKLKINYLISKIRYFMFKIIINKISI